MKANFMENFVADDSTIVIGLPENVQELKNFTELDTLLNGAAKELLEAGALSSKARKITTTAVTIQRQYRKVIAVGLGQGNDLTVLKLQEAIGSLFQYMEDESINKVQVILDSFGFDLSEVADAFGLMSELSTFRMVGYTTDDKKQFSENLELTLVSKQALTLEFEHGRKLGASINVARNYATLPPNELYPESFADDLATLFKDRKYVTGEIKDFDTLDQEGFGLLTAVGKGSVRKPRLVTIEYKHQDASDKEPIALIGKGITYDTGGYSLKTRTGMRSMKYDMSGAANVVGMMEAISQLELPVHVVAVLALAENMVDGNGMRPDDVYKSLQGKTVEVSNTDAEGRLVLADAVYYAADKYQPKVMMDFATLTGAVIQAIGEYRTGIFANADRTVINNLLISAKVTGEDIWQLPLGQAEENRVKKSAIADLINADFKPGGASFAAAFIKEFTKDRPWIHFDIAGTSNTSKDTPFARSGSTGVMIRTVIDLIESGTLYE